MPPPHQLSYATAICFEPYPVGTSFNVPLSATNTEEALVNLYVVGNFVHFTSGSHTNLLLEKVGEECA